MQNKRLKTLDRSKSHLWIVGGGIAGMAAAAFAIRDAKSASRTYPYFRRIECFWWFDGWWT